MSNTIQQVILEKKEALKKSVKLPLNSLGEACALAWDSADKLDQILVQNLSQIHNCVRLYTWGVAGKIHSSVVHVNKIDSNWRNYDISNRPYLKNNLPYKGMMLSSVYTSIYLQGKHEQCLTALQAVNQGDTLLGFVAADFRLEDILQDTHMTHVDKQWKQYKGDPAVRGTLFMQQRIQSQMDDRLDAILETIYTLITEQGAFHAEIHFSSGRCAFWFINQPCHYRMHGVEDMIDPDISLTYPLQVYSKEAIITAAQIETCFRYFKALRFIDETIYLRSASLNIMNGMVGLTFSCDGSHFMSVEEFLHKDASFWIGDVASDEQTNWQSTNTS